MIGPIFKMKHAARFTMLLAHVYIAPVFVITLTLSGCERSVDESQFDKITRSVQDSISSATKKISELTPSSNELSSLTTEEIEKLFNFEYKVIELESTLPNSEIEGKLSQLGIDRWECFHVEKNGAFLRIFCKRRPKTFLRYIQHIPFL